MTLKYFVKKCVANLQVHFSTKTAKIKLQKIILKFSLWVIDNLGLYEYTEQTLQNLCPLYFFWDL